MPRVIITQSRGDAPRLAEWVTYHARLGFTEFHMILDGLVDDSAEVLSSLEVGARVVVHRYPEEGAYFDDLSPAERSEAVLKWRTDNAEMLAELPYRAVDPQSLRQYRRVGEVLAQITDGQRGWVAHIDADEFIHIPEATPWETSSGPPRSLAFGSAASTSTPRETTRPCRCSPSITLAGLPRTSSCTRMRAGPTV